MEIRANDNVFRIHFTNKEIEERLFIELVKKATAERLNELAVAGAEVCADQLIEIDDVTIIKDEITPTPQVMEQKATDAIVKAVQDCGVREAGLPPFMRYADRKLVVGKCKCGKGYGIWLEEASLKRDRFAFTCKDCEEKHIIVIDELVPATYNCPNCQKKSSFWVIQSPEGATVVECKACESEVDLFYNAKKKIMTN